VAGPDASHPPGTALSAFVDGELAPDAMWEIGRHLLECPECWATVAAYRGGREAIKGLRRLEPPPSLRRDLERRIAALDRLLALAAPDEDGAPAAPPRHERPA
jgi:anti-sigma factor RsiW